MKTITFNDSGISAYIFDDEAAIEVTGTNIVCPDFVIGDLNENNLPGLSALFGLSSLFQF